MNKATLQRFYSGEVTFGKLTLEWLDHPDLYTIELPWRDNKEGISCIPQGIYNVTPHNTRDKPNTFELLCVPDRSGILIHIGNYASDVRMGKDWKHAETKGCILIGLGYDKSVPMVTSSVKALDWMRENIVGNWCIEVKNEY